MTSAESPGGMAAPPSAGRVAIALDWTPNTNHVGFYAARAFGWYQAAGLDVRFISPATDGYKATPASRLVSGEALLAVTPKETVVSYFTAPESRKDTHPRLRAVGCILQDNTSAIVTLKSSGIDSPKQLDGKRYASYGARYEGRIVQQMIKSDGGKGKYEEVVEPMLTLWDSVVSGKFDATWVFMGWEGVEAEMKGVPLNVFMLQDYGIPYGEGPMIVALDSECQKDDTMVAAVMAATARGYQWAANNPDEAGAMLADEARADGVELDRDMCVRSMRYLQSHFLDRDGKWGSIQESAFGDFVSWLHKEGLLTTKMQSREGSATDTATLDELRAGDGGDLIPLDAVPAKELYTNKFVA